MVLSQRLIPLRGRVAVRPIEPKRVGSIFVPDTAYDNERDHQKSRGKLARSSHLGIVLAAGAPAVNAAGWEVPLLFSIGDEVVYVFGKNGTEESRWGFYGDEPCVWIAQEEVQAVIE